MVGIIIFTKDYFDTEGKTRKAKSLGFPEEKISEAHLIYPELANSRKLQMITEESDEMNNNKLGYDAFSWNKGSQIWTPAIKSLVSSYLSKSAGQKRRKWAHDVMKKLDRKFVDDIMRILKRNAGMQVPRKVLELALDRLRK